MKSPIPDYLEEVLETVRLDQSGELASYIPQLATADPDRLAAVFATLDGQVYGVGDVDHQFSIQSISKPFVHALALADRGFDDVLFKVDVEPSGEAFNELSLEGNTGRPRNPMINAGAITIHSLVGRPDSTPEERFERVMSGLSAFAGRRLEVDEAVYTSEMDHAYRNIAIAYMLRSYDIVQENPIAVVEGYTKQCALLVSARDLAVMAVTLANQGLNPVTGEQVVPPEVIRQVVTVMSTCGMYDSAGDWATQVGIPAKSGVAGGLIGVLPGQVGLATFSPRLDAHGNSVRGIALFERISEDMDLHLMEMPPVSQAVVRSNRVTGGIRVVELQGDIRFAGAERLIREIVSTVAEEPSVAIDVSRVHSLNPVAYRMLMELIRRLSLNGYTAYLIDPEDVVPNPDPGGGGHVTVVRSLNEIPV